MGIEISNYLKEQALKTLELMSERGTSKEYMPDDKSFLVSVKKEIGCIAKLTHKGKEYYLCQIF